MGKVKLSENHECSTAKTIISAVTHNINKTIAKARIQIIFNCYKKKIDIIDMNVIYIMQIKESFKDLFIRYSIRMITWILYIWRPIICWWRLNVIKHDFSFYRFMYDCCIWLRKQKWKEFVRYTCLRIIIIDSFSLPLSSLNKMLKSFLSLSLFKNNKVAS